MKKIASLAGIITCVLYFLSMGLFLAVKLVFLCVGLPFRSADRAKQRIKAGSLLCSALCITGFIGGTFINGNLWYAAPMGYGIGLLILCVLMLRASECTWCRAGFEWNDRSTGRDFRGIKA